MPRVCLQVQDSHFTHLIKLRPSNSDGIIFDVTREDGYPFGAHQLDIKYHAYWGEKRKGKSDEVHIHANKKIYLAFSIYIDYHKFENELNKISLSFSKFGLGV